MARRDGIGVPCRAGSRRAPTTAARAAAQAAPPPAHRAAAGRTTSTDSASAACAISGTDGARLRPGGAYADAFREAASSRWGVHDQMMGGGMPAMLPERLERREQMLKKTKAAAVPLYRALSPEQKQTADALMMGMGMM